MRPKPPQPTASDLPQRLDDAARTGDVAGVRALLGQLQASGVDGADALASLGMGICVAKRLSEDKEAQLAALLIEHVPLTREWGSIAPVLMSGASNSGTLQLVKALHQAGISVLGEENDRPLFDALRSNHEAVVRYLLAHGADPHAPDGAMDTALWHATTNLNLDLMECLHGLGVDPHAGAKSLMEAACYGAVVAFNRNQKVAPVVPSVLRRLLDWGVVPDDEALAFQDRRADVFAPVCHAIGQTIAQWQAEQLDGTTASHQAPRTPPRL